MWSDTFLEGRSKNGQPLHFTFEYTGEEKTVISIWKVRAQQPRKNPSRCRSYQEVKLSGRLIYNTWPIQWTHEGNTVFRTALHMNTVWCKNARGRVLIPAYFLHPVAQKNKYWDTNPKWLLACLSWEGQSSSSTIELLNQSASSICKSKAHSHTFWN